MSNNQAEPSSITAAIPGEAGSVIEFSLNMKRLCLTLKPSSQESLQDFLKTFQSLTMAANQKNKETLTRQFKYSHLYLQTFLQHIIFLANGFCQVIPNFLKLDDV